MWNLETYYLLKENLLGLVGKEMGRGNLSRAESKFCLSREFSTY